MKKLFLPLAILLTLQLTAQNVWTARTNLTGFGRENAFAFSIGGMAYIGTGITLSNGIMHDLWAWDQMTNTWSQVADFAGNRVAGIAFAVDGKGYAGLGYDGTSSVGDFWEYDPAQNQWNYKGIFPGGARSGASCFTNALLPASGYVTGGGTGDTAYFDLWQYTAANNSWLQRADYPGGAKSNTTAFSIGNYGYVGCGKLNINNSFTNTFYQYNSLTDTWTPIAPFPGSARFGAVGFSIGNKGYVGTGWDSIPSQYIRRDFYEWNQATDTWTQVFDLPGPARCYAVAFSVQGKGYVSTGSNTITNSYFYDDLWEYGLANNVGVAENAEQTINIFPNPAKDFINVTGTNMDRGQVVIFDVNGKRIMETGADFSSEVRVDISALAKGNYFLEGYSGGKCVRSVFSKIE
jgi:N-acetylneuraminic acid mutarotase